MSSCIIPYVVPPLHGLRVLVTRPAEQGARLSELIVAGGGEACVFPSLAIEAIPSLGAPAHTRSAVVAEPCLLSEEEQRQVLRFDPVFRP